MPDYAGSGALTQFPRANKHLAIASIKLGRTLEELEVLRIVSERLEAAQLPFMLTGSFAMAYYGKPRMTRDLDIVVSLGEDEVRGIVAALSPDFYIDEDSVRSAVVSQPLLNLMHLATSIKVDLIVRKGSEYRQVSLHAVSPCRCTA